MHEITGLELGLAINELKARVVGSYIKKFYDMGNDSFRISFHSSEGNFVIYCNLLATLNQTAFIEESAAATNFAIAMRKRIEDSKVTDFYQYSSDRIAVIEAGAHGERHRIVIEMFGKGNLILVDQNDTIELCYKSISYKDRDVRPKAKYIFPKSASVEIARIDARQVDGILQKVVESKARTIAELSKYLNLGPIYLEDIIVLTGLNPKDKLDEGGKEKLKEAIMSFLERVRSPSPVVYMKDGAVIDYSVVPLKKYDPAERVECKSISEMLDRVNIAARAAANKGTENDTTEIDSAIAKQKQLVGDFNDNSAGYAESARKIFARMGEVNELIMRIKAQKKPELEKLKAEFPDLGIKEINMKDKKIVIEL